MIKSAMLKAIHLCTGDLQLPSKPSDLFLCAVTVIRRPSSSQSPKGFHICNCKFGGILGFSLPSSPSSFLPHLIDINPISKAINSSMAAMPLRSPWMKVRNTRTDASTKVKPLISSMTPLLTNQVSSISIFTPTLDIVLAFPTLQRSACSRSTTTPSEEG